MAVDVDTNYGQITESKHQDGATPQPPTPEGEAPNDAIPARRWASQAPLSVLRQGIAAGVLVVLAVSALAGWLGYRAFDANQTQRQRQAFIATARQEVLNLTTIDYTHVESDVARILDKLTGTFHDDFEKRSQALIDAAKRSQSKSTGTTTEAGLQSAGPDGGQLLVTVAVQTTNAAGQEPEPRLWRMRIGVQKIGDTIKVSSVEFVA